MTYYREERRPPQDAESLFECDLQSSMGRETVVYPHVHDYFEALYCLSGGYELYVSGAEHPFSAGDLVLIDPNEVHHTRSSTDGLNQYLVVKFMPEALLFAEHSVFELQMLLPYLWSGPDHRKFFEKALLEQDGVDIVLRDLLRETQTRAPGFEMAIRADLCRLFLWAARQALRSGNQTEFRNIDDAALMTLRRAYSYIDANSAQPLSMEEVAAHCGMKYTAFSRFFARYTQKSFPEYLTEVRLKKATILLTTTQDSVTEIALTAGFSTSSYFIQRFRRKHGVSPGRFRRQFLSGLTPNG